MSEYSLWKCQLIQVKMYLLRDNDDAEMAIIKIGAIYVYEY